MVRDRVDRSLAALERALTFDPEPEGIFDFQDPGVRKVASDYAELARALRDSLASGTPVSPQSAPTYGFHLRHFFEDPPDRAQLTARLGVEALVGTSTETDGLVLAPELYTRWDELLLDVVIFPRDHPEMACPCDPGYTCGPGYCVPEVPYLFTERAFSATTDGADADWPRFINPLVRDIFELGL